MPLTITHHDGYTIEDGNIAHDSQSKTFLPLHYTAKVAEDKFDRFTL